MNILWCSVLQVAVLYWLTWSPEFVNAAKGPAVKQTTPSVVSQPQRTVQSLSVLIVACFATGHQIPVLAVGEELARRGHNVTFFTTEIEGSNTVPHLPERLGMRFLSAGRDYFTRREIEHMTYEMKGKSTFEVVMPAANLLSQHIYNIRKGIERLNGSDWDFVMMDVLFHSFSSLVRYVSSKWGEKVLVTSPILMPLTATDPSWCCASFGRLHYTDNVDFVQRLLNVAVYCPIVSVMSHWLPKYFDTCSNDGEKDCMMLQDESIFPGVLNPLVIFTAYGLDYPRAYLPTVHYVGPALMQSLPPLQDTLQQWLSRKTKGSVIYISMGSTAQLTKDLGSAIVEGILLTQWDVVWSLRETNRDILEGVELDKSRFFVSQWISQQAVLQHTAVGLAIMHCGLGGIQEAIYHGVSPICIPFVVDQFPIASIIEHRGVGIRLDDGNITKEQIFSSVKALESGEYRQRAVRLGKILRHAGGARKAADLVEHYAEVGYHHLVPAYAKYKWSWVQYYNVDVYALLLSVTMVMVLLLYKTGKCVYKNCPG